MSGLQEENEKVQERQHEDIEAAAEEEQEDSKVEEVQENSGGQWLNYFARLALNINPWQFLVRSYKYWCGVIIGIISF